MSITGEPGRGPMRVGIPIADLSAGLFCALGILVALLEREQSGKGQWVATSLLQAQIFMLDFQAARWLNAQRGAGAGRQQSPDQHPDRRVQDARRLHQYRRRRQGPCGSGCAAPSAPRRCMRQSRLRDRRGALQEPRRAQRRDRAASSPTAPAPSGWSASTRPACRAGRSTPSTRCSPIRRSSTCGSCRTSRRADERGKLHLVGQPMTLARTPSRLAAPPPERGEHTEEVLREFGFSDAEIASLRQGEGSI